MRSVSREIPLLLSLAVPVALSQLGLMAMTLVDTVMVGPLGAEALAGAGVGTAIFFSFTLFGAGCLFGMDPLAAAAFGAGRRDECDRWLVQGVWLAAAVGVPLAVLATALALALPALGVPAPVAIHSVPYLEALATGLPAICFFAAFRQYLAAQGEVRVVTALFLTANAVNAGLNWIFIYGRLGVPPLGTEGSGWATTITRTWMLAVLVLYTFYRHPQLRRLSWLPDGAALHRLTALGIPAGLQLVVRSAVFSIATPLAARLGSVPAAAHTIVLNLASFLYMIPVGVSVAAAVRVGHSRGAGDDDRAERAGRGAMWLAGCAMGAVALGLLVQGSRLVGFFTDDNAVIASGAALLWLAAAFQIFDAVQAATVGALRGMGDTGAALKANLVGHWLVGLPTAWWLAFPLGYGVVGLWGGLTLGLLAASGVVALRWARAF